jgi:hypothetical protein
MLLDQVDQITEHYVTQYSIREENSCFLMKLLVMILFQKSFPNTINFQRNSIVAEEIKI